MNVLGPMTNPAGAKRQVIGVFSQVWQRKVAQVLQLLGSEHAMVVHSNGLDEIHGCPHSCGGAEAGRHY